MDPNLYQAARQLPPGDARIAQLYRLATSPAHPQALAENTRKALLMVAALLLATGLIFWIAANWQEQSRLFRLGLIEAALAASVLLACLWPRVRLAALLCATLVLGGLLAFVGQTYQTGADAWQLFAVWAGLALVWVCLARSDLLWCLWVLIAGTGIVMWVGRFYLWNVLFNESGLAARTFLNMGLWLLLAVVPALVSFVPALRVHGGMGWWSHRVALVCALTGWSGMVVTQLVVIGGHISILTFAAVALLVGAVLWLSLHGHFRDFVSTCLATLAVNVLALSLFAHWLAGGGGLNSLLVFGLVAMGCLGFSVRWMMGVQRRMRTQEVAR